MNNKSFSIIAIVSAVVAVIVAGVAIFLFVGRKVVETGVVQERYIEYYE